METMHYILIASAYTLSVGLGIALTARGALTYLDQAFRWLAERNGF